MVWYTWHGKYQKVLKKRSQVSSYQLPVTSYQLPNYSCRKLSHYQLKMKNNLPSLKVSASTLHLTPGVWPLAISHSIFPLVNWFPSILQAHHHDHPYFYSNPTKSTFNRELHRELLIFKQRIQTESSNPKSKSPKSPSSKTNASYWTDLTQMIQIWHPSIEKWPVWAT